MITLKNKGKKYSEEDIKRTRVVTLLFLVLMSGIFLGTMLFCRSGDRSVYTADAVCHGFIKLSSSQSVLDVFIRSVSWTSFLLIILFIAGLCSISQPVELMVLLWRGTAIGISVSYMYSIYELKGVLISALMILPHAVITSVILVFAAREALRSSNLYILHLSGKFPDTEENYRMRLYFIRFAVLFAAALVSSVIDSALTYLFTDRLLI